MLRFQGPEISPADWEDAFLFRSLLWTSVQEAGCPQVLSLCISCCTKSCTSPVSHGPEANPCSSGFCVLTQFARWGGVFTPGPKATLTGFQAQGVRTTESETGGGPWRSSLVHVSVIGIRECWYNFVLYVCLLIGIPVSSWRTQPSGQRSGRWHQSQALLVSWCPQVLRPSRAASVWPQVRSWLPWAHPLLRKAGSAAPRRGRPCLPYPNACVCVCDTQQRAKDSMTSSCVLATKN